MDHFIVRLRILQVTPIICVICFIAYYTYYNYIVTFNLITVITFGVTMCHLWSYWYAHMKNNHKNMFQPIFLHNMQIQPSLFNIFALCFKHLALLASHILPPAGKAGETRQQRCKVLRPQRDFKMWYNCKTMQWSANIKLDLNYHRHQWDHVYTNGLVDTAHQYINDYHGLRIQKIQKHGPQTKEIYEHEAYNQPNV